MINYQEDYEEVVDETENNSQGLVQLLIVRIRLRLENNDL